MAIIETFGLSRHFGKTAAVEGLTLTVEGGEVLGFLGPNGAGKTTTESEVVKQYRCDRVA